MTRNRDTLNHKSYIVAPELLRVHYAKNQTFSFTPSEDIWRLDVRNCDTFDLSSIHESQSEYKASYLKVLTYFAERLAPPSFKNYLNKLRSYEYPDNLCHFKQLYPRIPSGNQTILRALYARAKALNIVELIPFADFLIEVGTDNPGSKFLDPKKGAYSDKENASISYAFRVTTDKLLRTYNNSMQMNSLTEVNELGVLVAHHLMRGILRRPTQLIALKWSDFRSLGVGFHHTINSPELIDSELLHVRIFKGKTGDFRGYAEKRSIRLESDLSSLIILYHRNYMQLFTYRLNERGIRLNNEELSDLRGRLPVFPDVKLFTMQFNKQTLLTSLSMNTKSFHKSSSTLWELLSDFSKRHFTSHLRSERVDSEKLTVGNNRIRHTALTNGARKGNEGAELAQLTGVTLDAVKPYIDLSNDARREIDEALSDNRMLNQFGRIPVVDLQSQPGFVHLNELDEEIAIITAPHDCNSCKSDLGKPLGCYPCPNFKPLATANHQYYLDKAERKLALNSSSNTNSLTFRKLREIVIYIQATILGCSAWKHKKMESSQ